MISTTQMSSKSLILTLSLSRSHAGAWERDKLRVSAYTKVRGIELITNLSTVFHFMHTELNQWEEVAIK